MAALNQSLLFQSHLKVNFCWSLIFLSFACIWTGCNSNQHVKSFSLDEVKSFIGRQNTQYNERFSMRVFFLPDSHVFVGYRELRVSFIPMGKIVV